MDGEITAEELQQLLASGTAVRIIDIRAPAQFDQGHIPSSENMPFGELTARIEELSGSERVVTVCPHGHASVQAARLIGSFEGFSGRVDSLKPGIEGWPYELETADESSTPSTDSPDAPF